MRTITKDAIDVHAGDIFSATNGRRYIVVDRLSETDANVAVVGDGATGIARWRFAGKVEVEAPEQLVTREQLDFLIDVAQSTLDGFAKPDRFKLKVLLDELRPPEPPTIEEALVVLCNARDQMREHGMGIVEVNKIIERARRAGKIK